MSQLQPDELLVHKAREGSPEAFDALVLRYQYKAVALSNSVLRNMELAKDSSQNAFMKAYFGLKKFKENAQFKTWFFRIVMNEAKDTLRKEKSRGLFRFVEAKKDEGEEDSILELIPSPGRSPKEEFEAREAKKKLEEAIRTLPPKEQEVFLLRHLHDMSLEEVAQTLNIAVGTVKAHLSHGFEKVKTYLTRQTAESIKGR